MKTVCLPLLVLLLLTACAGQPGGPNPFDAADEFAARRALESIVVDDVDREAACAHVTEVLMDLDCLITEVNSELGLVSARTEMRTYISGEFFTQGHRWDACARHDVTVSVRERGDGRVAIRATFDPSSEEASRAFDTLLRRSIASKPTGRDRP